MSTDLGRLGQAVAYTLGCLDGVRTEHLTRSTPCAEWDLTGLLMHLDDSLVTLDALTASPAAYDGERHGVFAERAVDARGALDSIRARLEGLHGHQPGPGMAPTLAEVPELPLRLPATTVAAVAAVECAVHGWDIAQTCGTRLPIPDSLAADLLDVGHRLAPPHIRAGLFAAPVPVTSEALASDRLVAYLGRQPRTAALAHRNAR